MKTVDITGFFKKFCITTRTNLIEKQEYQELLNRLRVRMYQYMKQSQDGLIDSFYQKVVKPNGLDVQ